MRGKGVIYVMPFFDYLKHSGNTREFRAGVSSLHFSPDTVAESIQNFPVSLRVLSRAVLVRLRPALTLFPFRQKISQDGVHKGCAPGGEGKSVLSKLDKAVLLKAAESLPEFGKGESGAGLKFGSADGFKQPEPVQQVFKKEFLRGDYAFFPDTGLPGFHEAPDIIFGIFQPGFSDNPAFHGYLTVGSGTDGQVIPEFPVVAVVNAGALPGEGADLVVGVAGTFQNPEAF